MYNIILVSISNFKFVNTGDVFIPMFQILDSDTNSKGLIRNIKTHKRQVNFLISFYDDYVYLITNMHNKYLGTNTFNISNWLTETENMVWQNKAFTVTYNLTKNKNILVKTSQQF